MHTATRLAAHAIPRLREWNPSAHLCAYGLYAPLNEIYLRSIGVQTVLGGECEAQLAALARGEQVQEGISLDRLRFPIPNRVQLPVLSRYSHVRTADGRKPAGYTEASRGCKHLCRHCPVVPVYQGQFRILPVEVVLSDVRQQVASGAEHITFGDPDFWNGPTHARRVVTALHAEFPAVTYDVTIKIEHLLQHAALLPELRETGCLFITTAVESLQNDVLIKLEKGHTRADFFTALDLCRGAGLSICPTFIPFTPWTTLAVYQDLLATLASLGMADQLNPVQLALRLLIPSGSRLLELPEIQTCIQAFDGAALLYRWQHPDPAVDALAAAVLWTVHRAQKQGSDRRQIFQEVWELACGSHWPEPFDLKPRATIPYLEEPWYC